MRKGWETRRVLQTRVWESEPQSCFRATWKGSELQTSKPARLQPTRRRLLGRELETGAEHRILLPPDKRDLGGEKNKYLAAARGPGGRRATVWVCRLLG